MGVSTRLTRFGLGAMALALAGFTGCCSYTNAANRAIVNAKTKTVTMESPNCGMNEDATIMNARALYNDQTLQCFVEVQSTVDHQQNLQYLFTWHDADGAELKDVVGWHTLILDAQARPTVQSSAPKPGAEKATFSMRPASGGTIK